MFEWATGLRIARELGLPYKWIWESGSKRSYGLGIFGLKQNPPPEHQMVMNERRHRNAAQVEEAVRRVHTTGHNYPAVSCPFQEEGCFAPVAEEVREAFRVEPLRPKVQTGRTPVGVHVRRGDFVNHPQLGVTGKPYFRRAFEFMKRHVAHPHFFIVSDDPTWCEKTFREGARLTVLPRMSEKKALQTLVGCEAHIISNSTFGWWGAWLGEEGPVVAPEHWCKVVGAYGNWKPVSPRWRPLSVGGQKESVIEPHPAQILDSPTLNRAIVYPYKADVENWHELRYSLRSVDKFFEDKECPIFILGSDRPGFLTFGDHRVQFINRWSYQEALVEGVQLAREVLWMNDDVFLLQPTTWGDCEVPYYMGEVAEEFLDKVPPQQNRWRAGAVKALEKLREMGITEHRIYSTHCPYVYERDKAVEVLGKFGVWDKFPMELAYFHLHPDGSKKLDGQRVHGLPFGPKARFLNLPDASVPDEMKQKLREMFPEFSPWELKRDFE